MKLRNEIKSFFKAIFYPNKYRRFFLIPGSFIIAIVLIGIYNTIGRYILTDGYIPEYENLGYKLYLNKYDELFCWIPRTLEHVIPHLFLAIILFLVLYVIVGLKPIPTDLNVKGGRNERKSYKY